ncbi:hypothetical protein PV328_001332 [Microctonus aethiopoides]|uniref:Uncharacterized protein n=1 Tax=Microctonus aethiopoides TaxID=144406 RepID=A0AA39FXF8_9HYME|nr:hypothetical protein PV328_001332 [Microctonus aethiopoides]
MNMLISITGGPTENFEGRKLPSMKEVMSVFLYQKTILKLDHKQSLRNTIDKVEEKWSQAGIPTCGKTYALRKFKKLLDEKRKLQKNPKRKGSNTQKKKEAAFRQKLTNLFDIAKMNVEKYITDDKKLFLSGQRSKSRFGFIDNIVQ